MVFTTHVIAFSTRLPEGCKQEMFLNRTKTELNGEKKEYKPWPEYISESFQNSASKINKYYKGGRKKPT
jgi:hypothetical protein